MSKKKAEKSSKGILWSLLAGVCFLGFAVLSFNGYIDNVTDLVKYGMSGSSIVTPICRFLMILVSLWPLELCIAAFSRSKKNIVSGCVTMLVFAVIAYFLAPSAVSHYYEGTKELILGLSPLLFLAIAAGCSKAGSKAAVVLSWFPVAIYAGYVFVTESFTSYGRLAVLAGLLFTGIWLAVSCNKVVEEDD